MTIIASKQTKEWNYLREEEEKLAMLIGSIYYNIKRNIKPNEPDLGKTSSIFSDCIAKLTDFSESEQIL
jgi:hypothetical protein